jgi:hypothetical protein
MLPFMPTPCSLADSISTLPGLPGCLQGGAAYGFDPLFRPSNLGGGCLLVSSPPSGQMTCSFWASSAFDLRFCSDTQWIPWFDCNVPWPWQETALATSSNGSSGGADGSSGGADGRATAAALDRGSHAGAGAPLVAAAAPAAVPPLSAAAAQSPTPTLLPPGGEPLGVIGG